MIFNLQREIDRILFIIFGFGTLLLSTLPAGHRDKTLSAGLMKVIEKY